MQIILKIVSKLNDLIISVLHIYRNYMNITILM